MNIRLSIASPTKFGMNNQDKYGSDSENKIATNFSR
jgi:hypothetical protein